MSSWREQQNWTPERRKARDKRQLRVARARTVGYTAHILPIKLVPCKKSLIFHSSFSIAQRG